MINEVIDRHDIRIEECKLINLSNESKFVLLFAVLNLLIQFIKLT